MPAPSPSPLPRIHPAHFDPLRQLDRRVNAWRTDIADIALAGLVGAHHYVQPVGVRVSADLAPVRAEPRKDAEMISQLLSGEIFDVLERGPDWCWGRCQHDHYVGYVPRAALEAALPVDATHRVRAAAAHVFADASIKSSVQRALYRGSLLRITGEEGKFAALAGGGFIRASLICPATQYDNDPVQLAGDLLETPYLWGGRSRAGIDCSGLVQISLQACGIDCPRDSDMQQALGEDITALVGQNGLLRGDLIFFPGHVGIMADGQHLLHANAHHMKTVIEPLADVVTRLLPDHNRPITAARRLKVYESVA
jgi:cell wall-associated NlpC family hydrolase